MSPMSDTLVINEIYLSLQGESTFAGLPCIFVRLTACNLRCSYCDTAYAFTEGKKRTLDEIGEEIKRLAGPYSGKHLSLTPGFSRVYETHAGRPAVLMAFQAPKTAEPVKESSAASYTGLKPGVNETSPKQADLAGDRQVEY